MTLTEVTNLANSYTDESFTTSVVMGFANVAISNINTTVKSKLPLFADASTSYTALDESWIHMIIIPYVCYSIKMNDGSLNEAGVYQNQFYDGLNKLRANKTSAIAEAYQGEEFTGVYVITPYSGMSGSNTDNGF